MTPKFTTPCFIRKNTAELRTKLEKMGRKLMDETDGLFLAISPNRICSLYDTKGLKDAGFIDCGTDEALFLDLAAMRSDTDKGQLLTKNEVVMCLCETDSVTKDPTFLGEWRKSTPQEIIEWHKQKGEKQ